MMKRTFGSAVSALGIAAATLVAFAGGAMADGPRHGGGPRFESHRAHPAPAPRFAHGREHGGHHGNNGAAVALGIGALFLGAVIAAEANRRHADRDYD